MKSIRTELERRQYADLHPAACLPQSSAGRRDPEPECDFRTAFMRDRDRILHCKAFRRLKHKTQVFLAPSNDHYRTRLTHTLEVSQIARSITRALALNEDLTEAIALGHDLGHTPLGHAGERVLNDIVPEGFHHARQSLRVVEELENDGQGLNLCTEVRDGILLHTKGKGRILSDRMPGTLEGQIVRISDAIAYLNHDIDDALRAEVLRDEDIPAAVRRTLGATHSERIDCMVKDVIAATLADEYRNVRMSAEINEATEELKSFMYGQVYPHPRIHSEFEKAYQVIKTLYEYYLAHIDSIPAGQAAQAAPERQVCDHIAGMTDRYLLEQYNQIFIPKPWGA